MPTLFDHRGRPIELGRLSTEIAEPQTTGVRSIWRTSVASNLTPARLAALLRSADEGDADAFLTLAEEMEERDWHYRSVLGTRKLAVSGLAVSVESPTDLRADIAITDEVRELVETPMFGDLVDDLLDALGKGFAVAEIMWSGSGRSWTIDRLEQRDQRFFQFERPTGDGVFEQGGKALRLRNDTAEGAPLPPWKFIVHYPRLKAGLPIRGGLARVVSLAYMCKQWGLRDWMAFVEVFGLPLRIGRYGPSATTADRELLRQAVANIASDAAAILPESMRIEFVEVAASAGGTDIFERLASWLDKQVSKAVLGQTMTTDDGSSRAQAVVHNDVRSDLVRADVRQIERTIARDLIRPFVDLNHGARTAYPRVRFAVEEREDLESLAKALTPFIDRGLPVEASVILDRFGIAEPAAGALLLRPSGGQQVMRLRQRGCPGCGLSLHRSAEHDAVDEIEDEALGDWRPMVEPILDPIRAAIGGAASWEELLERLEALEDRTASTRLDTLTRELAAAMFRARGLGDATDDVR